MAESTNNTKSIPPGIEFALCATALLWAAAAASIAARAAHGIATRLQLGGLSPLLESAFLLFLVVVGFRALDWIATRGQFAGDVFPLPARPGRATEWTLGAALGWALCVVAALPVVLSGHLHGHLTWGPGNALAILLAIATLLLSTLAIEVIFRGYPFQRLSAAIGEAWAALLLSLAFAALVVGVNPPHNFLFAILNLTLFGLLLSVAWMRTHGLWLPWGIHFAYRAVAAVLLGLPIAGRGEFGAIADMYVTGPRWITGGAFGLDAALLTAVVMLGGIAVLYRVTRDYSWQYTAPVLIPAGYEVSVAPPAAHLAMEKSAAPPPLVQILASTPQTRSVESIAGVPPPPAPALAAAPSEQ